MKFYRPAFVEIDLGAIRHNLHKIEAIAGNNVKILGVVKKDAYGHGAEQVSRTLLEEGVEYLGVASLDEARELRKKAIKSKIIVLGAILPQEAEGVIKFDVIQAVSDMEIAKALSKLGQAGHRHIKVHIKIDTGMGRLGFWHGEAVGFVKKIFSLQNIIIDGIFTHFPSAEDDLAFTRRQIKDFNSLVEELERCNIHIPIKHASNSMALVNFKESHMNMVRPGIIMYGLCPRNDLIKRLELKPAFKLKTKITHLKRLSKGRSVSYGRTYIAKRNTVIAAIPVGYGDGYSRHLSNRADVLIRGRRVPIAGRICMDMTMIDVGSLANVKVGDDVVLVGVQGKEAVTIEELAGLIGTIPYEVVCNIGARLPHIYKNA